MRLCAVSTTSSSLQLNVSAATDLVHIQWTGSDTHNNGQNEGDGQAGDTGQGAEGTDRNNLIQMLGIGRQLPHRVRQHTQDNVISRANCYSISGTVYGGYALTAPFSAFDDAGGRLTAR